MVDEKRREAAESMFRDASNRGTESQDALTQEAARRAALLNNMQRLRALRLANSCKQPGSSE